MSFSWYGSTHFWALSSACSCWVWLCWIATPLKSFFIFLSFRIYCLLRASNCIAYCFSSISFCFFIMSASLTCCCLSRLTWSVCSYLNPLKWYGFTLCGASILTSVYGFSVIKSWLLVKLISVCSCSAQTWCWSKSLSFFSYANYLLILRVSFSFSNLFLLWSAWASLKAALWAKVCLSNKSSICLLSYCCCCLTAIY